MNDDRLETLRREVAELAQALEAKQEELRRYLLSVEDGR